ncbi:hypothetical protein GF402_02845 [Candidatus Fermentibacteria bacterium]|nr:hypothetical protein [Candidatus Fermentibacteria bacterium]
MLLLAALLVTIDAGYAPEGPLSSSAMLAEVDPYSYLIGPGDVLWLTTDGGLPSEMADSVAGGMRLQVTPDGNALVPLIGPFQVAGSTLAEASEIIEENFDARFRGLRSEVGLARMRHFRVPITGKVASPGVVTVTGAQRLSDVLFASCGGISPSGSWSGIFVIHSSGDTSVVDLASYFYDGDPSSNPALNMGDHVHVPQASGVVVVEGAVLINRLYGTGPSGEHGTWPENMQAYVEHRPGETVSELLDRVGGLAPWAFPESTYIARDREEGEIVRISAQLGDPIEDPVLLDGDVIVCPGAPSIVTVSGHVANPGRYPHFAGMDPFYYIGQAGGVDDRADVDGTRITAPSGAEWNIEEVEDVLAGSTIEVPRKTLIWWQDYLTIATGVASVVIAWKSIF